MARLRAGPFVYSPAKYFTEEDERLTDLSLPYARSLFQGYLTEKVCQRVRMSNE